MTAYERADRGGAVWLRWGWGGGKPKQRATTIRLRRDDGTIDPHAEAEAMAALALLEQALAAGQDPDEVVGDKETKPSRSADPTLREGFDEALLVPDGHYASEDANWRQAKIYSSDLCEILGATTRWSAITQKDAARVWRAYATWKVQGVKRKVEQGTGYQLFPKGGHDTARRAVWWLYEVAERIAEPRGRRSPSAPSNWHALLKADWDKITGTEVVESVPRFTDDEVRRIMKVLPKADPRIRLAIELGLEARLGQVTRTLRSRLDLRPNVGVLGFGAVRVPGKRKKNAPVVDLTKEQRALIDQAMADGGYLSALETARLSGKIADYPLFPAGVMRGGVAAATAFKPWTTTGIRQAFMAAEAAAKVEHLPGRGWYGLRRWAADRAEDYEKDERALNALTGHKHTSTRRGYQEREATGPRKKAAEVRQQLRDTARKKAPKGA